MEANQRSSNRRMNSRMISTSRDGGQIRPSEAEELQLSSMSSTMTTRTVDPRFLVAFFEALLGVSDGTLPESNMRRLMSIIQQPIGLTKAQIKKHTVTFAFRPPTTRLVRRATGEYERPAAPTCSICMNSLGWGATVRRLACLDFYHARCIDRWLEGNTECPNCRTPVIIDYQKVIEDFEIATETNHHSSAHHHHNRL